MTTDSIPRPVAPARVSAEATAAASAAGGQRALHRRALLVSGPREAGLERAWALCGDAAGVLWVGASAPGGVLRICAGDYAHHLGREYRVLVYDAWSGFDPDAFGALTGTVRGGGGLILVTPPLEEWPGWPDPEKARIAVSGTGPGAVGGRYLRRLARLLREAPELEHVGAEGPLPPPVGGPPPAESPGGPAPQRLRLSRDQARAVAALRRVALGRRRRPLVLAADRGRGKSAAFGIAAAAVLGAGRRRVIVTAPRREAVDAVLAHAAALLPDGRRSREGVRRADGGELLYLPPDRLLRERPAADLVLVDEAAAIPAPLLEGLLGHYARIAFATSEHGYEGSGRGFGLRFSGVLDRLTPHWRRLRLETPVRWAPGDPLEALVSRALMLAAEPAPDAAVAALEPAAVPIAEWDRDVLVARPGILEQAFGLLVAAHYRTRPYDLRYLLDGPNIGVWLAVAAGQVAAVAMVAGEGGLSPGEARAVWAGRRRPRGHMLPETLAAHLGLERAPRLRCLRLVRIAVHPALQGRGLGRRLVAAIEADAAARGFDYVGVSFGATPPLLRFWQRSGWVPVRLSARRGASSGLNSAILLRGLSPAGRRLEAAAREVHAEQFPAWLADPGAAPDPEVALALLGELPAAGLPAPGPRDLETLAAYAWGGRQLEVCLAPMRRLALDLLARGPRPEESVRRALYSRLVQGRGWTEAARAAGVPGRRQVDRLLRRAAAAWLEARSPGAAALRERVLGTRGDGGATMEG